MQYHIHIYSFIQETTVKKYKKNIYSCSLVWTYFKLLVQKVLFVFTNYLVLSLGFELIQLFLQTQLLYNSNGDWNDLFKGDVTWTI